MRVLSSAATLKGEDGALDFGARGLDGLAGFLGEGAGKFFFALRHGRGNDRRRTRWRSKAGRRRVVPKALTAAAMAASACSLRPLHDAGDQAAVVGGANLDEVAILMPPAIHKETVRRNRRDRHLGHDFFGAPMNPTFAIIGLWTRHWSQANAKTFAAQGNTEKILLPYNGSLTHGLLFVYHRTGAAVAAKRSFSR